MFTIVFVTPLHIIYTKPSNDPIFRADTKFRYPGDTRDYYKNGSPKSRAFACIDETLFCGSSGTCCWHEHEKMPSGCPDVSKGPAYWFMVYSLKKSNAYDSIKLRLGSSLIAQQRVGLARSQPLADNHWQLEAEHMFKTSLARAQFDAWSLASGEDNDDETYMNTVPNKMGDMCGLFKFHAIGHVNVQIWPFFVLCAILPLTLILSVETETYRRKIYSICSWMMGRVFRESQSHCDSTASTEILRSDMSNNEANRSLNTPSAPVTGLQCDQEQDSVLSNQGSKVLSKDVNTQPSDTITTSSPGNNAPQLPGSTITGDAPGTTPLLNAAAGSGKLLKDYGTTNSARTSHDSSEARPTASLAEIRSNGDGNGDDENEGDHRRIEKWSPLLIQSIILIPVYLFQWLVGTSSGQPAPSNA